VFQQVKSIPRFGNAKNKIIKTEFSYQKSLQVIASA
jgi:hypothetical protein